MMPCLDWEAIGKQLITASQKNNAMFHILDLQELRVLIGISGDRPDLLLAHLSNRFMVMVERKHALLRVRLNGPPLP